MDPTRFDQLVRSLAHPASRRQALGGLLGGALAVIAGGTAGEAKRRAHRRRHANGPNTPNANGGDRNWHGHGHATHRAKGGNRDCAHFCAAVFGADTPAAGQCTSDAAHGQGLCQQCGTTSPTDICCARSLKGFCLDYAAAACCAKGQTCGGGGVPNVCGCTPQCVNKPCGDDGCGGSCGSCSGGLTCCQGACKAPTGGDCTTGGNDACCSGVCVAGQCVASCGAENSPCDDTADCCHGTTCANPIAGIGVCCASGNACGTTCCASADQICDPSGACCTPHDRATTCAGRCGIVTDNCGQTIDCSQDFCTGATPGCCDNVCVDLATNVLHCGTCAITCNDGSRGSPGCCGGGCVDFLSDRQHCGTCTVACTAGTTPACCSGGCVDLDSDATNCGGCAQHCTPEAIQHATAVACQGGHCLATACETGFTVVAGACCPNANLCGSGPSLTCCGSGQTCCGGVCTDTSVDPNNCGGCGQACPANVSCAGSSCSQGGFGETCSRQVGCSYTNNCTGDSCLNGRCCIPGGVSCVKEQITFHGVCCCNPSLSCPSVGACPNG